jgi:Reverse transcriptase (RNA-dependent DNA polymerase)
MLTRASLAVVDPRSYLEATSGENSEQWKQAMKVELTSIEKNICRELVPRSKEAKVVGSKYVYRVTAGGLFKASFGTKRFTQRWDEDYAETYAPAARYDSIRTVLANAAGRNRRRVG